MTKTLEDKEILDLVIGGQRLQDMAALTFLQYVTKKINGVPAYSATNQELVAAVSHAPLGRTMPDSEKIRLVRKMLAINIEIP